MELFNFFPSLEKSNEAYFGQSAPLAQDLLTYSGKLKDLLKDATIKDFKNKQFMKTVNNVLTDFGEAVKLDINAEKVSFLLVADETVNAGAYPIFIRADSTVKQNDMVYVDLDKIADIEDIIITSEGYQYRNSKNKLLCIKLNVGLFRKLEPNQISGVIAHEIGHCFQDGIFGVYKDIADLTYVALQESSANTVDLYREKMPKFIKALSKIVGFRLLFIIFTYLRHPHYLFTSGIFSGIGVSLAKIAHYPVYTADDKTFKMKDQIKKIDEGDTALSDAISSNSTTEIIQALNKDNDRDKFLKELAKDNKEEWKVYLKNSKALEPVNNKFIEGWRKLVIKFDNIDSRIVSLLTLSKFTNKVYSKSVFYKRWEFFADIFATSYGFGPETYNFLANTVTDQLSGINMGLYWKYHLYKRYIENSEYDVHGTNKQRLQNIYTDLVHELNSNTDLTSEQRKNIQKQIDDLKRISEFTYEQRKVNGKSLLAKAYNRLIDDRINEVSHKTEEEILKPIDDLCKEVFIGKHKKEIKASLEHLYI